MHSARRARRRAAALAGIASVAVALAGDFPLAARAAVGRDDVRPPAVAGKFYPGDPSMLRRAVDVLVQQARPSPGEDVRVIVAPHAGYVFSGQIAADALAALPAVQPDLVVLLGANHTGPPVQGFAVFAGRAFRTPLGEVAIDHDVTAALLSSAPGARVDAAPHAGEHSIEVLLPFVQVLAPRARIVPVIVGSHDVGETARFGRALVKTLEGRRALVVASSDLSHYPPARDAAAIDRETLRQLTRFDADGLASRERDVRERPSSLVTIACGLGPLLVALEVARTLGATRATVVSHATSSEVAVGDPARVVGYGAVVFQQEGARPAGGDTPPSVQDNGHGGKNGDSPQAVPALQREALLRLARATMTQFAQSGTLPLPRDLPEGLASRQQGVFVTIRKRGELRGCIGRVLADVALPTLVSRAAFEAAFHDPRFAPVTRDELEKLEVEISVLTPPREVASAREIVVGRDGVLLRKAGKSSVFLPQVATEQGWTRDEMLDALCDKAGLSARCWTDRARLATFQAEVFAERR